MYCNISEVFCILKYLVIEGNIHRSEKMITNLEYFRWWSTEDVFLIVTWKLFCGPQFLGIRVVEFSAGKFFRAPMIPKEVASA